MHNNAWYSYEDTAFEMQKQQEITSISETHFNFSYNYLGISILPFLRVLSKIGV